MYFVLTWWQLIIVMIVGPVFFKVLPLALGAWMAFIPAFISRTREDFVMASISVFFSHAIIGGLGWILFLTLGKSIVVVP